MKLDFLKKMAVRVEKKKNSLFTYSVKKQKEYISHFKIPINDIERSYFQYCCQIKLKGWVVSFLMNLASLPFLIYYYYNKNKFIEAKKEHFDSVFFSEGVPENIIPDSLKKEFETWFIVTEHGEFFTKQDKQYFKYLFFQYPLSWHFLLKCLIKLRLYSYEIEMHSPKAIVVCGEYSFTSSLLTDYCKKNNILHINIMHGEKLYFIRDSFFRFDRCYIWDEYYLNLFKKLRADTQQFIIEIPPSLKFEMKIKNNSEIDYTYYLAAEEEAVLEIISKLLSILKKQGYKIAIRPHPIYSDEEQIREKFEFLEIENTKELSIEESLIRTKCAISLYSTVLNQAICNSIPAVIDDISNPYNYRKLKELEYICLNKEHKLLSDIL